MIAERIKQFIDTERISVRNFEQRISASNGMIRKAIAKNTDIQSKWISLIVDNYPQINPDWLLTGSGPMLRTEPRKTTEEAPISPDKYEKLEKEIRKLTHDLSKKCMDLTTALTDQQNKLTEIIASQQRLIEALTHKK